MAENEYRHDTNHLNVACSSAKPFTEGVKVTKEKRNDTLLKRNEPKALT